MHLEPVEDARVDGLDQVGGLELRVLERVAADEGGALEDDVVELAPAAVVRADRADERAGAQPLAAQDRILRRRDGDDDVALAGVPVALARLRAVLLAERGSVSSFRQYATTRSSSGSAARIAASCDSACQPQPIRPRLLAAPAARYFAATPLAAPVRSCPSLSASITATSSGESARKRRTTKRAPSRKPAYTFAPA